MNDKFNFIANYLQNNPKVQFKELSTTNSEKKQLNYNCVFIPLNQIDLLHKAISTYLFQEKYPTLAKIKSFFITPSWKRDAFIGFSTGLLVLIATIVIISTTMGVGAIPALILGPALVASLGATFTGLTLTGIALGLVGFFTGISIGIGSVVRCIDEYQPTQLNDLSTIDASITSEREAGNIVDNHETPLSLLSTQGPQLDTISNPLQSEPIVDEEEQAQLQNSCVIC